MGSQLTSPSVAASTTSATASTTSPLASAEQPFRDADLICVVGTEPILAGDLQIFIEPYLAEYRGKISEKQLEEARKQMTRQALVKYVEVKALYIEFFRESAGKSGANDLKEAQQKITTKANELFYEKQVPHLLKTNKVTDLAELEKKLRTKGLSINLLRQQFTESALSNEVIKRNVPDRVEVSPDEIFEYYKKQDPAKWHKPGKAKWRQLTARFDRFPTREQTRAAIEAMGNEVYLGGKPFEAVAKEKSQGFTAASGGVHDWTTQGALKSKQLDAAIFSIEPKRLSQIIEDDFGFHIIEVLERQEERTTTFDEAYVEMRDAISKQKVSEKEEAFRKKIMDRTVIWTRWPEDIPGSRSLLEVVPESPLTSPSDPR